RVGGCDAANRGQWGRKRFPSSSARLLGIKSRVFRCCPARRDGIAGGIGGLRAGRGRTGGIRLCVSWSFRGGFRECAGSPLGRSAALVMAVGLQKFAQKTAPPADPAGGGVKTGLELAGVVLDLDGYKQQ